MYIITIISLENLLKFSQHTKLIAIFLDCFQSTVMYMPTLSDAFNELHQLRTKPMHKVPAISVPTDTYNKSTKPVPSPQTPISPLNLRPPNEFLNNDTFFTRPRKLRQSRSVVNLKTRKHLIVDKDLPPLPKLRRSSLDLQKNCMMHMGTMNGNDCDNFTLVSLMLSDIFCLSATIVVARRFQSISFAMALVLLVH